MRRRETAYLALKNAFDSSCVATNARAVLNDALASEAGFICAREAVVLAATRTIVPRQRTGHCLYPISFSIGRDALYPYGTIVPSPAAVREGRAAQNAFVNE
jgi:hypothetical protein